MGQTPTLLTPLETLRDKGGTMALWKSSLYPYIMVLPSTSPDIIPLLLDIPGQSLSIHIEIYMPTRGQEHKWLIALAALSLIIEDICAAHPDVLIYI